MERKDIFVKPIWVVDVDIDNSKLVDYAYKLKDSDPERRNTTNYINDSEFKNTLKWRSYYLSNDQIDYCQELKKLISLANEYADKCFRELNPKPSASLHLNECWFNINQPTDSVAPHVHPGTTLVMTYYIRIPENSGDIVFQNIDASTYWNYPPKYFVERNPLTNVLSYMKAREGRMVFFPANMMHYVQTNHSSEDRICMTFNYIIKDNTWFGPNHKQFNKK